MDLTPLTLDEQITAAGDPVVRMARRAARGPAIEFAAGFCQGHKPTCGHPRRCAAKVLALVMSDRRYEQLLAQQHRLDRPAA